MSTSNKGKSKYVHSLKGPERLSPVVVKDIIESRGISGARTELAKKYGISETRVGRLWIEYYGGGKLSDFKSGIKKPLPTEPINNADITVRNLKTSRGEYVVREPKVEKIDSKKDAQMRAKPTRVYKPSANELILDESAVDDISDHDAAVIAGEIGAGNNNPELIEVFNRLIESRDRDTTYLYKLAKRGLKKNILSDESDYDCSNIEETDDDDSTAVYKQKPKSNAKYNKTTANNEQDTRQWDSRLYQNSEQIFPSGQFSNSDISGVVLRNGNVRCSEEITSRDSGKYTQVAGTGARAQPVYIGYREEPAVRTEKQSNPNEFTRYEPSIPATERNPNEGRVQPNNTYNSDQRIAQPGKGNGIPGGSRNEPRQTVPGIPWLGIRPY